MDINGPGDPIVIPSTPEPDAAPSTSLTVRPHQVFNQSTPEHDEPDAQPTDNDLELLEGPQEPSNPAISQMIQTVPHQLQSMPALSTPATDLNTLDRASTLSELRSIPASSPAGNTEANGGSDSQGETVSSAQFAKWERNIEPAIRRIMNGTPPESLTRAQLERLREMQMRMATHFRESKLQFYERADRADRERQREREARIREENHRWFEGQD